MLSESMLQMPSLEKIEIELYANKFENIKTEKYFVSEELEDCFLYCGKQRPELYLNPEIRNGISSFADLANKDENVNGLFELKKDIKSGNINNIINEYENSKGDYLFIIGSKASG